MKIIYFGKEQTGGFIETVSAVQGGYLADVHDDYIEYLDWSSFDFIRQISDEAATFGRTNTMKHYNEYWYRDDDNSIISTTWKLTKVNNGVKETDPDGYTWSKVKADWTSNEMSYILEYDRAWLEGKIASLAKAAYARLNLDSGIVESGTWSLQLAQAQEYRTTGSAGILLSTLAAARGESAGQLADKIIAKNESYQKKVGDILAIQQKLRKELDRCVNVEQLQTFAEKYTDLHFGKNQDKTTIHQLFRNIA
jgi:hypothetical protein